MDTRALLYQLLYDDLIEIRYEANEGHGGIIFRLADLIDLVPLQLERMERGEIIWIPPRCLSLRGAGGAHDLTILLTSGGKPDLIRSIPHKAIAEVLEARGLPPL